MAMPTRIDADLYEVARAVAPRNSRSAAQQINHWARIGRQLEETPQISHQAVQLVLLGKLSYDELPDGLQAVVRAEWAGSVAERIGGLDLQAEMLADGASWAETDATGATVRRGASASASA